MAYSSVADLTVDELRNLIKEVVTQQFWKYLATPMRG
jgi:hypothetical protein